MHTTIADAAKDRVIFNITGTTREEIENKLNLFFTSQGYTPKPVAGELHTYTKGSRIMRMLFGAFVKYHKQSVTLRNQGDLFSLMLAKESTGISGGLIGMNQATKEFARLSDAFKEYFSN